MACPRVSHLLVQDPQSSSVEILLLLLLLLLRPIAERVISDHALLFSHLRSRALGSAMSCSACRTRAEVQQTRWCFADLDSAVWHLASEQL